MINFFRITLFVVLSIGEAYAQQPDSSANKFGANKTLSSFRSSLSTSYIIQKNFYQNDMRSFLFIFSTDYLFSVSGTEFNQSYHIKADLGYLKYVDSVWSKNADSWKVNILFREKSSKTITHTYALNVSSQFLNTYRFVLRPNEEYARQWRGSFFNPASINFSYNVSIGFWDYSCILLGLSSVRVSTLPRYEGSIEPKETPFAKTKRSYILAQYGMSGQVNIYSKKISENITWDNTSSFFVNGISKDRAGFDFQNRFVFRIVKYVQFRFDTHVIYDPLVSYNLQYDQEFLVGVFFEKKK